MRLGRLRVPGFLPASVPAAPPSGGRWSLEVQIHPSDIRKRVRYLFLSRRQLTFASLVVLLYLAAIALALAVAPGVVGGMMSRQEYQTLIAERARQGERLQGLIGQVDGLDRRARELDLRVGRVFLAYGLPPVRSRARVAMATAAGPPSIYTGEIEQGRRLQARARERLDGLDASLAAARAFESAHPDQVRTVPSACPLHGRDFVLVSGFERRRNPFTHELERHTGVDLAAPVGTPVYAPADGVVAFAGEFPVSRGAGWWRYGNLVMLENGDGFVTLFGHDDRVEVRQGQRVRRGDLLATVGNSGWSTSPHLYYEVRRKGTDGVFRPVDPLIHILDHRWPNEEQLLLKDRAAAPVQDFEPLPSGVGRQGSQRNRPQRSKEVR
jgi:murein DD-endopeptidase MepM/ murein hydrolase activator NlpD